MPDLTPPSPKARITLELMPAVTAPTRPHRASPPRAAKRDLVRAGRVAAALGSEFDALLGSPSRLAAYLSRRPPLDGEELSWLLQRALRNGPNVAAEVVIANAEADCLLGHLLDCVHLSGDFGRRYVRGLVQAGAVERLSSEQRLAVAAATPTAEMLDLVVATR